MRRRLPGWPPDGASRPSLLIRQRVRGLKFAEGHEPANLGAHSRRYLILSLGARRAAQRYAFSAETRGRFVSSAKPRGSPPQYGVAPRFRFVVTRRTFR